MAYSKSNTLFFMKYKRMLCAEFYLYIPCEAHQCVIFRTLVGVKVCAG